MELELNGTVEVTHRNGATTAEEDASEEGAKELSKVCAQHQQSDSGRNSYRVVLFTTRFCVLFSHQDTKLVCSRGACRARDPALIAALEDESFPFPFPVPKKSDIASTTKTSNFH